MTSSSHIVRLEVTEDEFLKIFIDFVEFNG